MKFKVGEQYKVKDSDSNEYNNIIEITGTKPSLFGDKEFTYEIVENVSGVNTEIIKKSFCEISEFANCLVKVVRELPRKFYVKCKTEERVDNVLKKAEELGYKWNSGDKATAFREFEAPATLFFDETIMYNIFACDTKGYEKVRYKDFIAHNDNSRYTGKIIFVDGDEEFETGHVYEIEKGKLKRPGHEQLLPCDEDDYFKDFDDVVDYFKCTKERTHRRRGWSSKTLTALEVKE